ncbi:GNAT family N-acetyltransferase [Rothia nasimurium]|uniref:GNAT family N-acetyltransferase n=1 Tax=Rothia nasimurium TaxID=85336 RepID=UPI001F025173|nr:DUF4081 domain-containing GNAT family N-acetyltransferase [Rothia nasimurium]
MSVLNRFTRGAEDALIRPLTLDDRAELETMISADPVGLLYAAEHLHHFGLPATSTLAGIKSPHGFMGIFAPAGTHPVGEKGQESPAPPSLREQLPSKIRSTVDTLLTKTSALTGKPAGAHFAEPALPGMPETLTSSPHHRRADTRYTLVGAFWLGANCVPISLPAAYYRQVAAYIRKHNRRIGSIFGHQDPVLGLWEYLAPRLTPAFDVRDTQPLLELPAHVDLGTLASAPLERPGHGAPPILEPVRWARTDDRPSLMRASVAMFTEEVGYDPMTRDPAGYSRRIDELTRTGRTVVAVNAENIVIFKTDIGLAHETICQLQGVWLHPAYRGQKLAPVLLAQACQLIRQRFPHLTLYVNDYNAPARALYAATGWQQVGTFATILL